MPSSGSGLKTRWGRGRGAEFRSYLAVMSPRGGSGQVPSVSGATNILFSRAIYCTAVFRMPSRVCMRRVACVAREVLTNICFVCGLRFCVGQASLAVSATTKTFID